MVTIFRNGTCASKPGPARPRAIGRLGASACTILCLVRARELPRPHLLDHLEVGGNITPGSRRHPRLKLSARRRSLDRPFPWVESSVSRAADGPAACYRRAGFRRQGPPRGCRLRRRGSRRGLPATQWPIRPVVTQLLDLPFQLLRPAPELPPLQLGNQQLQAFDLGLTPRQLFVLGVQALTLCLELFPPAG